MMAVAENTLREGKSAQDSGANTRPVPVQSGAFGLSRLCFSFMLMAGWILLVSHPVQAAGIHADSAAPKGQQPTVLQTANGIPQVNIQTPSAAGVSVNQYRQFDVGSQGAILNNSRRNIATQTGGWMQGNPWLAGGEAKIIVNQINSSNPSQLKGYIEVAGRRAEVIMANPAGIQVAGGGFINASGVTLTTGLPVMNAGHLEGFRVRGGSIGISGKGLDTSDSDYTRILAGAAQVNAGVWAKELTVVGGRNDLNADASLAAVSDRHTAENDSKVAIDTGRLGGMYAGKINLISTAHGVGVNNAGQIFAGAGGITLSADGKISNSGSMVASGSNKEAQIGIRAAQLDNSGSVSAQKQLSLDTGNIQNSGLLTSATELNIRNQAELANSGSITAARLDIDSGSMSNSGTVNQTGLQKLAVKGAEIRNSGLIGHAQVDEPTGGNHNSSVSVSNAPTTAAGSGEAVSVSETAPLMLAEGRITVANRLDNAQDGRISGNGMVDLSAQDQLHNQGRLNVASLQSEGSAFHNQGNIQAAEVTSRSNQFANRSGIINSLNQIHIQSRQFDNRNGKMLSAADTFIQTGSGANQQGDIASQTTLQIEAADGWDNQDGRLAGNQKVSVESRGLNNQGGEIASVQNSVLLNSHNGALNNQQGQIQAAQNINIQSSGLDNRSGTVQGKHLTVQTGIQAVNNTAGKLLSQTDLQLSGGALNNSGGQMTANRNLALNTQEQALDNRNGMISAGGNANIQSGAFNNQSGTLGTNQKLLLNTHLQAINNQNTAGSGGIFAESLSIKSGDLDNRVGTIGAATAELQIRDLSNQQGKISVSGQLQLSGQNVQNQSGVIQSSEKLKVDAKTLDNQAGQILAKEAGFSVSALSNTDTLANPQGGIQAEKLSLQTDTLNNSRGRIVSNQDLPLNVRQQLNNEQGLIAGGGKLNIASDKNSELVISNKAGQIQAQGDMQLNAYRLINSGEILSNSSLAIRVGQQLHNSGLIAAEKDISLTAAEVHNNGRLNTQGALTAQTDSWNNQQGRLEAHTLILDSQSLNNQNGLIQQNGSGNLNITTHQQLNNQSGVIGAETVDQQGTVNQQPADSNTAARPTYRADNTTVADSRSVQEAMQTISSDGQLNIQNGLNNQQGRILAGGLTQLSGSGRLNNNAGLLNISDLLWRNGSTFSNLGGSIHAGQSRVEAASLDNNGGRWISLQGLQLSSSGQLNNIGGQLVSGAYTQISAGQLDNSKGRLLSTAALNLNVNGQANNQNGIIQANQSLLLQSGGLDNLSGQIASAGGAANVQTRGNVSNQQGRITAAETLNITAQQLDNQQGLLSGKQLSVDSQQAIDNRQGRLQAADALNLSGSGLDNQSGDIRSNGRLDIDTRRQNLNNQSGRISALGDTHIQSGALNNEAGQIQSNGRLSINTHGQNLNNRNSTNGGLLAQGALSLASATLDNQQGRILSSQSITADTVSLNNQGGEIQAADNVRLNNQEAIDNQGGLLAAGNQLSIQTGILDNSQTQGNQQGMLAADIQANAQQLNNQQGQLLANQNIRLAVSNALNNRQGKISAADGLHIAAAHTANQAAELVAGRELNLQTGILDNGKGNIRSLGTLKAMIQGDYLEQGGMAAAGDAAIRISGSADNQGQWQSGGQLNLHAQNLNNHAAAEINAADTRITVEGRLNNRGLIDGQHTLLQAQHIDNRGGQAKIYGDNLAISAITLNNDTENGQAGTIAARRQLNLGVKNLTNREQALIFSEGNLNIGGRLNADYQAEGWADSVQNNSATIEAGDDLHIAAGTLHNTNEHFKTELVETGREHIVEYSAHGRTERYREGTQAELGWTIFNDESDQLRTPDGQRHENWYKYDYWRTTQQTQVTETAPANIIAGGNLTLSGGELWNSDSRIVAGKKLNAYIEPGNLHNQETLGIRIVQDQGCAATKPDGSGCYATREEAQRAGADTRGWNSQSSPGLHSYWRNHDKGRDSTGHSRQDYLPAPEVSQGLSLGSFAFQEYTAVANSNQADRRQGLRLDDSVAQAAVAAAPQTADAAKITTADSIRASAAESKAVQASEVTRAENTQATQTVSDRLQQAQTAAAAQARSIDVARTTDAAPRLPTNSLFAVNPANSSYLVESDPRFTQYRQWLSSNYMLDALHIDPGTTQKRLGDGYYEQKLMNEQVLSLTGRRYLNGYSNNEAQFKALMDAGITAANSLQLTPGIALSAEQIARLTSDIIWLVSQTVTLPDGSKQTVLAPQVYVRVQHGDIDGNGALLSGNVTALNVAGKLNNSGTIAGREALAMNASIVDNINGKLNAARLSVHSASDINNTGGSITAADSMLLQADRDINLRTTTGSNQNTQGGVTYLNRMAGIYLTGNDKATLTMSAGRNINLTAAEISNLSNDGQTQLHAGHDINLDTVQTSSHQENHFDADNHIIRGSNNEIGSSIQTQGDVTLLAGNNLNARAAEISSANGTLAVAAKNDINITAGINSSDVDDAAKHTGRSGGGNKLVITDKVRSHNETAQSSTFDGKQVIVQAGHDANIRGSNVISDNDTAIQAGNNVRIDTTETHSQSEIYHQTQKSGLMSAGIGFTIGSKQDALENQSHNTEHTGSTVGSLKGSTTIIAGNQYSQIGSTVSSPKGDTLIAAKNIDVEAAQNQFNSKTTQTHEQKGLTVAFNSPVTDLAQQVNSAVQSSKQVGQSKNGRVNAMAAANTGWQAYQTYQGAKNLANGKTDAKQVSISITYGEQKNQQTTQIQATQAQASQIQSGGKTTLIATGAGKASNINITGSDVAGKAGTILIADNNINLQSAEQTNTERSKNKSEGWNAGVAISIGQGGWSLGVTAGGNIGKGYGNGDSVSHRNSHVGDKNSQTIIQSGGDTTVKGAQVMGKGIQVDAQNLTIESRQDTETYQSKQQNASAQVTVGYGFSASGDYSQSKVNADRASVTEQSGIFADDDGYRVNVKEHTDLKGGIITSTHAAEGNGKNRFSTGTLSFSDIQNHSEYEGESFGLGGGMDINGGWKGETVDKNGNPTDSANSSVGYGSDSDSRSGTTKSGINARNISITDEAGQIRQTGLSAEETIAKIHTDVTTQTAADASGSLKNVFDKDAVQRELDLQREVSQEFDKTRQEVKQELYAIVDDKRAQAAKIRRENGGYDNNAKEAAVLDKQADELNEKIRWVDAGLGSVWGAGNSDMAWSMFATTQADRAVRSATAPKEMWFQKKVIDEKTGEVTIDSRQIWSLSDLSKEELASIQDKNGKVITVSNPGIFNNREDSLKNAAKQNLNSTNSNGVIVVMNPPTGKYEGWWLPTSLVSELMYVGYDQLNNKLFQGYLPKTNSEKLNQDIYREVKKMENGWSVDPSNHSRGGITASVALKDWVNNKEQNGVAPIRKARFYGTATNVQNDYADVLQKNGHTYIGSDGKTYNSGAYSIVHNKDFVGNKWIPFLLGNNDTALGACKGFCYSHSSYFAEVPKIGTKEFDDYVKIWGKLEYDLRGNPINKSKPKLVEPNKKEGGGKYEKGPF
nr:hemagglutinin repeat-containing protein [Neisseria sp.]